MPLKIPELQGVLLAYAAKDSDVKGPLLKERGKELRESLQEAIVVAVLKAGADGGFLRYSEVSKVVPKKK